MHRKEADYRMLFYISLHVTILILGLFYAAINSTHSFKNDNKKLPSYFFTIPSFLLLFIASAFRGDFTTDYNNYSYIFKLYNRYEFLDALRLTREETGYIFLSRLIGAFSDNVLYLFIAVSFATLVCFYSQFNKHSTYIWLTVLMFVTVGSYYASFNIMRQVLAAAIIFSGSKFLYERKLFKYFLVVVLASLFHKTSLIMIVFYFLLNLRFKLKNIILIFVGAVFSTLFLDDIVLLIQSHYYTSYTESAYGMTSASFKNAILPVSFLVFSLFNYKKIDFNDTTQRTWINAVIFYVIFSVLGLQIHMIERLTHFFAPYVLLLIPFLFSKIKSKEIRVISLMGLVFLLILYSYVVSSGTDYDPYYFIWDTR